MPSVSKGSGRRWNVSNLAITCSFWRVLPMKLRPNDWRGVARLTASRLSRPCGFPRTLNEKKEVRGYHERRAPGSQELLLAFHFDSRTMSSKIAFDWPPFLPDRSPTGTA